jgi:hypothetical protein
MAQSRIGLVVALSMAAGLIVAAVLVAIPLMPAKQNVLTGVNLLALAVGWALLAGWRSGSAISRNDGQLRWPGSWGLPGSLR